MLKIKSLNIFITIPATNILIITHNLLRIYLFLIVYMYFGHSR